eukprot:2423956-Rhodomonas_salina.1
MNSSIAPINGSIAPKYDSDTSINGGRSGPALQVMYCARSLRSFSSDGVMSSLRIWIERGKEMSQDAVCQRVGASRAWGGARMGGRKIQRTEDREHCNTYARTHALSPFGSPRPWPASSRWSSSRPPSCSRTSWSPPPPRSAPGSLAGSC